MVPRLIFHSTRAPWDPAHQLLASKYRLKWKISFLCTIADLLSQCKMKLGIVFIKLGVIFHSSVTFHPVTKKEFENKYNELKLNGQ